MTEDKKNEDPVGDVNDKASGVSRKRRLRRFWGLIALAVVATVFGLAMLVNIFQRKQEARNPFFRVVELTDDTVDSADWGKNFPLIKCARAMAEARLNRAPRRMPRRVSFQRTGKAARLPLG